MSGIPDITHLLGGGVLLLSFAMLYLRRPAAMIDALALQGALLAAATAWQGFVQDAPGLYVAAAIALAGKSVLIPLALRRLELQRGIDPAPRIGTSLIAGVALVALAVMVVPTRENLVVALSTVLLGLLMTAARRNVVIGLLSLENGVILAAIGVAGLPLVAALSAASLMLMLALVAHLHRRREAP